MKRGATPAIAILLVAVLTVLVACAGPKATIGPASMATTAAPPATPVTATAPTAMPSVGPTAAASATPAATQTANSSPLDARTAGWQSDLAALVPGMDALHPQLDHGVSIDELNSAVDDLSSMVPTLTDDELMVGVLRIVAMVSAEGCDAHTGAYVWGSGTYPADSLPLRLWLFDDGVYVVDALPPYEDLIGQRLDAVNGHLVDDVVATIDPIVPRDNDQTVRLLMPRFLLIPQILAALGIVDGTGPVDFLIGTATRNPTTVAVIPISMADYNAWAGFYGLHLPVDPNVLYLSRIDEALWQDTLEDGTLFVQYNRVDFLSVADLETALRDPATERVILDVRHNYGGQLSAMEPIISAITVYAADNPDSTYLITGRNTFSAGSLLVARLDAETDALIVGEPMGGCPNAWGNDADLLLSNSGIGVGVSTIFNVGVDPEDDRQTIEPDIPAALTPSDWAAGNDPALAAIDAVGE